MESELVLTPIKKKILNRRLRGVLNLRRCIMPDSKPNTLPTELFRPSLFYNCYYNLDVLCFITQLFSQHRWFYFEDTSAMCFKVGNYWMSEARRQGISSGTPVSSPPSLVNRFSQWNKAKIDVIQILSNSVAELSLHTTWHMTGCTWWMQDVLHVICTQLHPGHSSVHVDFYIF